MKYTVLWILFPFLMPYIAHAQEAEQAAAGGFSFFIPMILVFFVFYFLVARPQKKHQQEELKFQQTLQKGTEIYTKSGIIGTVVGITDRFITLEVSENSKIKILRNQVGGKLEDLNRPSKKQKEKTTPQVLGRGSHAPKRS